MKKVELFNNLVENAFDFLSEAISAIKKKPKYSIVHFYSAIELILKARLMNEHWSLVIARRQEPDWDKFLTGDFYSVSLDEAATRLKKIVRSGLSETQLNAFRDVGKYRNKMVHFFHKVEGEKELEKSQHEILRQELKAWYFLHHLLTKQWREEYSSWGKEIKIIDAKLRKLHEYLKVIFDNLQAQIKEKKSEGRLFTNCQSCGFESQEHDEIEYELNESNCLVCELTQKCININCPDCNNVVIFLEEGFATCESCKKQFIPNDLADLLFNNYTSNMSPKDKELELTNIGNCSECDNIHTGVSIDRYEWICVGCFRKYIELAPCNYCGELNTGNIEESYINGCTICDGMMGEMD